LDGYLAIAYFQQGVSNFLLGDFEEALANFNDTLRYLRGNTLIDYEQLGLKFQLYSCEALFNRGLCYIYLQQTETGMDDLGYAAKEKIKPDHDVIDEAIKDKAEVSIQGISSVCATVTKYLEGYTVFSIPVGVVYRPSDAKVKNLKTKEYLGKARLVAASDRTNVFTGFQGSEIKKVTIETARDDRPPDTISFAATNLVQRNLSSRTRQQSEPPIRRNVFPPTPPPEFEKPFSVVSNGSAGSSLGVPERTSPVRVAPSSKMNLDRRFGSVKDMNGGPVERAQNKMARPSVERLRIGTIRTASEPRPPPSKQSSGRGRGDSQAARKPLFRETTGTRRTRPENSFAPVSESEYPDEVFDLYNKPSSSKNSRGLGSRKMRQPRNVNENTSASDGYDILSTENDEFEMVTAPARGNRQGTSRRPEVRKIRAKVHTATDTRFIMIGSAIGFGDFEGKIREKFGLGRSRLKIKVQDDGDMVTVGDQDDLDLLLSSTRQVARKENSDMGKMEVS
jgi:hypothetical protein